jgi:hypothetical protein
LKLPFADQSAIAPSTASRRLKPRWVAVFLKRAKTSAETSAEKLLRFDF